MSRAQMAGEDVCCSGIGSQMELRLRCAGVEPRLNEWAARYDKAGPRNHEAELAPTGPEMFPWLDETGSAKSRPGGGDHRT